MFGATTPRRLVGTLPYLSPEAVHGDAPDASFDLWSLSVVLFEALAGRNPLAGQDTVDTMLRVRQADVPDLRSLRPDCLPALALFLRDALARERGRRPASARAFRARLEQIAQMTAVHGVVANP